MDEAIPRREAAMPPFARLVALIVSGKKEPEVERAARALAVQPAIRAWLARAEVPRSVRVQADVDPYSFL